ncbi:MAG: CHAD domain-containing protein [Candidatus Thiodiazotropha sp.]
MAPQPIAYLLPEGLDLDGLRARLAEKNNLREEAAVETEQTAYDSFDWRLWQAGGVLVQERDGLVRLCWVERKSGLRLACESTDASPGFARDLPASQMRELLAPVLEMRLLLPQVRIIQRQHTLRVVDDEEKTVVRVTLQENRFASPDGKQTGELEGRVLLKPLKGYDSYFKALRDQLEAMDLALAEQSLYEDALAGISRRPCDYSSKLNYRLDPEARSDVTAKKIMLTLLDTLEINLQGAKADLDSEFLHDLRVATRRSRSAMSQIKGVFEPKELAPFKKGFGWIGKVTGEVRDLDVYLLQYPSYRASLPVALQADLEPFHDFLIKHQKEAQQELVKKLNSPHFRKLLKSWRAWLNEPVPQRPKAPNARRSIAELSDQRLRKLFATVVRDGEAIGPDSPPASLHDLRKQCKKLRYLMEFFQSLYPKPEIRQLIKEVKILLDNLGEFQDLQVQAESLEEFGKQMMREGAPASVLMAMGILVGKLFERQARARDEFAGLFAAFGGKGNRQTLQKLLNGE